MQFITILEINTKHSLLDPFILSVPEGFTAKPVAEEFFMLDWNPVEAY